MKDPIEFDLEKQRREVLDLIASRCAEAIRAVEAQARKSDSNAHSLLAQTLPERQGRTHS